MNHGDVLVIGGTSDARAICQQLDAADVRYTLSVATPTGERLAGDIRGQIRCGRMEWQQMAEWLRAQSTRWVIDASHPLRRGGQPEYCARLRQRRGSAQPLSKAGAAEPICAIRYFTWSAI